jgi:hypothetical protein
VRFWFGSPICNSEKTHGFFPGKVSSNLNRIQSQDLPRDNSAGKFPEVSMKKSSVGHLPLHKITGG